MMSLNVDSTMVLNAKTLGALPQTRLTPLFGALSPRLAKYFQATWLAALATLLTWPLLYALAFFQLISVEIAPTASWLAMLLIWIYPLLALGYFFALKTLLSQQRTALAIMLSLPVALVTAGLVIYTALLFIHTVWLAVSFLPAFQGMAS